MKTNHVPATVRLSNRIAKLEAKRDAAHVPSDSPGYPKNPYYMCAHCRVHDPELSIRNGRHFGRCPMQGIDKEIAHYVGLLEKARRAEEFRKAPPPPVAVVDLTLNDSPAPDTARRLGMSLHSAIIKTA